MFSSQISEFQSAIQIPEMDPDELPDIPFLMPPISLCTPTVGPGFAPPAASTVEFQGSVPMGMDLSPSSVGTSRFGRGTTRTGRVRLPAAYTGNAYVSAAAAVAASTTGGDGNADDAFRAIASMMGLDQPSDGDDDTDSDDSVADGGLVDTDGETEGWPAAKKNRREVKSDVAAGGREGDDVRHEDGRDDALPDLPQPEPEVERGPSGFTAQEHTFLAWAKTMSTFTAKRQATVEMKINEIMSEAEFEDLDDEFFAGNITFSHSGGSTIGSPSSKHDQIPNCCTWMARCV